MKKPWYQHWVVWVLGSLIVLGIPFLINEAYKVNSGYITMWGADDVLAFYGSFLSFAGTVVLGLVAVYQNQKANDLAAKMLHLEEYQDFPIVDIMEVGVEPKSLPENALQNALKLQINDGFCLINPDNTLESSDECVVVFQFKNIGQNHIISMEVTDIQETTCYKNGERIESKINEFSYSGGIRVIASNEVQFLIISGINFAAPPMLTPQEKYNQEYINPTIELRLVIQLCNNRGQMYEEKIKLECAFIPNYEEINAPWIIGKEILNIHKMNLNGNPFNSASLS